jgi:peptide/nickel transport system permease protein
VYAYIIRRLLIGLLIIWGVYTITFFAVNLAPGDPFTAKESAKVSSAALDRLREKWGYDRPVIERYFVNTKRMFYGEPEMLDYEGGGIEFEVVGGENGNRLRAFVQKPPGEIRLIPRPESVKDDGAEELRIKRAPDGSYPVSQIKRGNYRFGRREFKAFDADYELDSQGVLITYKAGRVEVRPILASAPTSIRMVPTQDATDPLELTATGDGTFGPVDAPAGRYAHEGGAADVLVPRETIFTGGFRFDLGASIQHNQPVVDYLRPKFWATIKLGFWALLINYIIGIGLGVVSAIKRNTKTDNGIMVGAFFLYSMPGFWLGLMLQLVFAVKMGWLPLHGLGDGSFIEGLRHYAMPVFVLGVAGAAGTARYQRSAVLEVLREDYVRTARAKGVDERTVIWKHVMRNSLLPVITLFGLSLPFLVSGAVITEQVFNWPGIGQAAITAIQGRDVFVVSAVTLAATTLVVFGSLMADVLYALVDPRVRLR